MNKRALLDKYLEDKLHLVTENDSLNYDLVLEGDPSGWIFANIPMPIFEDIAYLEELIISDEQRLASQEAKQYLDSTDWMIIREMDTGVPCPEEVKIKRAEARTKII